MELLMKLLSGKHSYTCWLTRTSKCGTAVVCFSSVRARYKRDVYTSSCARDPGDATSSDGIEQCDCSNVATAKTVAARGCDLSGFKRKSKGLSLSQRARAF